MENNDGTYPHDVGSIEPIPYGQRTPILDMLPPQAKDALQGINGLLDDPFLAMPGGFARMPLKKLMQELAERKALYRKHGLRFQRAYKVQQVGVPHHAKLSDGHEKWPLYKPAPYCAFSPSYRCSRC